MAFPASFFLSFFTKVDELKLGMKGMRPRRETRTDGMLLGGQEGGGTKVVRVYGVDTYHQKEGGDEMMSSTQVPQRYSLLSLCARLLP